MSESKPLRGPFPVPGPEERPPKQIARLDVNGSPREVAVRPYDVLLDTLREDLGLTGTTRGCDMGTCGCCTVHVDGEPVLSCLCLTLLAEGKKIRTIEDMAPLGTELSPVQEAFVEFGGSQCGYCTPGFIMTTTALLEENPNPTDVEIRRAISGNMCRCTGYNKIVESVRVAAARMRGEEVDPVQAPSEMPVFHGAYDKPGKKDKTSAGPKGKGE